MEDRIDVIKRMIRETYLDLDSEEGEALARDIDGLLQNVDILANLPVEAAAARPAVDTAQLRADEPAPSLSRPDALANAPASHDGFVSVPKIIGPATEETPS